MNYSPRTLSRSTELVFVCVCMCVCACVYRDVSRINRASRHNLGVFKLNPNIYGFLNGRVQQMLKRPMLCCRYAMTTVYVSVCVCVNVCRCVSVSVSV